MRMPLQHALTAIVALTLTACGSQTASPTASIASAPTGSGAVTSTPDPASGVATKATIRIDGSSTVYPITEEVMKEYRFQRVGAPEMKADFSGTTSGFRKLCAGEVEITNASRPIKAEEMNACKAVNIRYYELPVAYDALTIAVHSGNTWVNHLTVAELKKIWEPAAEDKITTWKQVRENFPERPLDLYGADEESGTFDYFTEAIVGESGASRKDYTASENDDDLVRGVRNSPDGLGYFGLAYYEASQKLLRAVPIDSGSGPVLPSAETVQSGTYQPLARPLFIYVNADAVAQNPDLKAFVEYYLRNARTLVDVVGYVPLPNEAYNLALQNFQGAKVGTMFGGEAPTNLKIEDLLKKEAAL